MADWRIDVDARDAEQQLRRLGLFLRDLRSFWPVVSRLFVSWQSRQFSSEGVFFGRPWAPLATQYGIWKGANYPGKTILKREGDLFRAATTPTRRVTPTTLTLGIESPTVGFHQRGSSTMPARPLIVRDLPPVARAELDAVATDYVRDLLSRW